MCIFVYYVTIFSTCYLVSLKYINVYLIVSTLLLVYKSVKRQVIVVMFTIDCLFVASSNRVTDCLLFFPSDLTMTTALAASTVASSPATIACRTRSVSPGTVAHIASPCRRGRG